jgi:hypothetical protein
MINAQLTNAGDQPVTVVSIAVSSPDLAPVEPSPKYTSYAPGQVIDLRTPYGRPLCVSDSLTTAAYVVELDDGLTLTLPVDRRGLAWLREIYRHDCDVRALAKVAQVAFARDGRRVTIGHDEFVATSLVVRRPAGTATGEPFWIHGLSGSVLLRLLPRTAAELPFRLAPGVRLARVPVLIASSYRCGPHELSASQQTFLLSAYASTPDIRIQHLTLVPPARLRAQAQELLVDVCLGRP